ncbi:hypothetical protein HK097_011127, partial [Rhizophlyctis rosea]
MPPSRGSKISKSDISSPTPLNPALLAADSGISLTEAVREAASSGGPAITPFSAGRFDASASVAGGPSDPRLLRAKMDPQKLTMRQYQSFLQALAVYRRQVMALAAASETFVRALEELSDCVPAARITKPHVVGDLDFMIDSTHLIANAHQTWADNLERDFELPLAQNITNIMNTVKVRQQENKQKIDGLVSQLHREEDVSYKMGKKKQRDLASLQSSGYQSLNQRMAIADEIKRLTVENQTLHDTLSHQNVEYVLENCASGVRAELETYETIMEGLKKLGAYQPDADSLIQYPPDRRGRGQMHHHSVLSHTPTHPGTEVLPEGVRRERERERGG